MRASVSSDEIASARISCSERSLKFLATPRFLPRGTKDGNIISSLALELKTEWTSQKERAMRKQPVSRKRWVLQRKHPAIQKHSVRRTQLASQSRRASPTQPGLLRHGHLFRWSANRTG